MSRSCDCNNPSCEAACRGISSSFRGGAGHDRQANDTAPPREGEQEAAVAWAGGSTGNDQRPRVPGGAGAGRQLRALAEPRSKTARRAQISVGDSATVEIEPRKEWPEPKVPKDLAAALAAAPADIRDLWEEITPMARWEWVRWVNATANPDTRSRRVEVTISKMESGKRRPCCFNLSSCTDPSVSKSGKLMEPV